VINHPAPGGPVNQGPEILPTGHGGYPSPAFGWRFLLPGTQRISNAQGLPMPGTPI